MLFVDCYLLVRCFLVCCVLFVVCFVVVCSLFGGWWLFVVGGMVFHVFMFVGCWLLCVGWCACCD